MDAAVNVTYYYEALCKDCVKFIHNQLWPTYLCLRDNLNVDFVPFGNASWTINPWSIKCQHGPRECHVNAIQACALDRYKEPEMQIKFITCIMTAPQPEFAGMSCAHTLGYDYTGIEECAAGEEGRKLLIIHGTRTKAFRPPIEEYPTIAFNDKYSAQDQKLSLTQFKTLVCTKFPTDQKPPICDKPCLDAEEELPMLPQERRKK